MADISAFPSISKVEEHAWDTFTATASGTITQGQVVSIDASGDSMTVRMGIAESGECPMGVALTSAADGGVVNVACAGIVYVANADDTTAIDAGDFLEVNDNAVGGTINAVAVAATGGATVTVHNLVIGKAIDDIAGGATGRMLIVHMAMTQANSS